MELLYSETHTFEEAGLKSFENASLGIPGRHGHLRPCATLTPAEFTVTPSLRLIGLFSFENVL